MQIYQIFWTVVGDDWTEEELSISVGDRREVSFLLQPTLPRLVEFLIFVSTNYPEAAVVFHTDSSGGTMVLGKGTYGKNTYGVTR